MKKTCVSTGQLLFLSQYRHMVSSSSELYTVPNRRLRHSFCSHQYIGSPYSFLQASPVSRLFSVVHHFLSRPSRFVLPVNANWYRLLHLKVCSKVSELLWFLSHFFLFPRIPLAGRLSSLFLPSPFRRKIPIHIHASCIGFPSAVSALAFHPFDFLS